MTISELDSLMTKLKAGMQGMNASEFIYASKLYEAARNYREYDKTVVSREALDELVELSEELGLYEEDK